MLRLIKVKKILSKLRILMDISTSSNTVTITGNIKSVSDFQSIKSSVDEVKESNSTVIIVIKESLSITSSVIGYFNKLVLKDKINLQMRVGNTQLLDLLDELSLMQVFKATKI